MAVLSKELWQNHWGPLSHSWLLEKHQNSQKWDYIPTTPRLWEQLVGSEGWVQAWWWISDCSLWVLGNYTHCSWKSLKCSLLADENGSFVRLWISYNESPEYSGLNKTEFYLSLTLGFQAGHWGPRPLLSCCSTILVCYYYSCDGW